MSEIISDNYYALYIYLDAFWRRRYLIIASVIFTPFIVLLTTALLYKSYEANIAIAINNLAPPSMKDLSSTTDVSEQFAGLQEFLRSPNVLKKVAIETQLLEPDASAKKTQQVTTELNKNLTITVLEKSGIRISLVQNSPDKLTNILNALANQLINQLEFQNLSASQSSVHVLEKQLQEQKLSIKKIRDSLNNYQNNHADLLPAYGDIYTARLREITSDRGDAEAQYQFLIAEEKALINLLETMNPELGQIDNAIRENNKKLTELRIVYTDNFPGVRARIQFDNSLKAERNKILKQYHKPNELKQLWNTVITSTNNKIQATNNPLVVQLEKLHEIQFKTQGLLQKIINLKKQQDEINKKLRLVGDTTQTLTKLTQSLKNQQDIYDETLSRYNIAKITASMNSKVKSLNYQIIAYPQKPISPQRRPLSFFFILGIFAGAFLGFGLVLVFEYMDNTLRFKRDVEELTNLKVICRVEQMSSV